MALGTVALHRLEKRPRTDDAVVTANSMSIVPEVAGRIVEMKVQDDQLVHAGDVLYRIDPTPFELRLAQAGAQLRVLGIGLGHVLMTLAFTYLWPRPTAP